jgi:histidine triad (HIT) family protein
MMPKTKDDCIFCKIANGEIPSNSIYEDDNFNVILDLNPANKGHALIIPKVHYQDVYSMDDAFASKVYPLAGKVARVLKGAMHADGINILQNNEEPAGQTVFHFHVHVIPRYKDGPSMVTWKPGTSVPAEQAELAKKIAEAL